MVKPSRKQDGVAARLARLRGGKKRKPGLPGPESQSCKMNGALGRRAVGVARPCKGTWCRRAVRFRLVGAAGFMLCMLPCNFKCLVSEEENSTPFKNLKRKKREEQQIYEVGDEKGKAVVGEVPESRTENPRTDPG